MDTYSGPIEHSELPEGIKLCRLPHTASKFRILNKVKRAFVAGGFGSKTKAKIIHYHDPELTLFAPLWRLQGKSVIFDSHEDFVGEIQAKNLNRFFKFLFPIFARTLRLVASITCHKIIAATERIAVDYPKDKSEIVRNFPLNEQFEKSPATKPLVSREKDLCYVGAISRSRAIIELVQAANLSKELNTLHLAGNFSDKELKKQIMNEPGWQKVKYHGYLDRASIVKLLHSCRIGALILHPLETYKWSLPIKLLEYRAAGIPSICTNFKYWKDFAYPDRHALYLDNISAENIAAKIDWIITDKNISMFDQHLQIGSMPFHWKYEEERLLRIYDLFLEPN